jgi:hypothetical protein
MRHAAPHTRNRVTAELTRVEHNETQVTIEREAVIVVNRERFHEVAEYMQTLPCPHLRGAHDGV